MFNAPFLESQVKRANRNLLSINILIIIGILAFAYLNWNYLTNFCNGPLAVGSTYLDSVESLDNLGKDFITVVGDKSFVSGLQEILIPYEKITNDYVVLKIDHHLLLVEADHGREHDITFSGRLIAIPPDVYNTVIGGLEKVHPSSSKSFIILC